MSSRILVVDDEVAIAETLRRILEVNGYTAMSVSSGLQAIAKLEDGCPDLLLSDVMMPGLNGFETGMRIKQHCPGCRLLFFSGYTGSPEIESMSADLKNQGFQFELLAKPLHPLTLLEKVKATLEHDFEQDF